MPRKPNYNIPLPTCEGPQLDPFKHRNAEIDFQKLLSDADPEFEGHAHVFEVSIMSIPYALKVVRDPIPYIERSLILCLLLVQVL